MTNFKPMSDTRQENLLKAASEVIDMVTMTVDPDAALRKVAKAYDMKPKEIDLVSHAVNNALAYEHIHEADEHARSGPFPLTNAETVRSSLYPDKVQEVEPISECLPLAKNAESSYYVDDYLSQPEADYDSVLSQAWFVEKVANDRPTLAADPFAFERRARHEIDELSIKIAQTQDGIMHELDNLRFTFRRVDAPDFDRIKTAAVMLGANTATIEAIADSVGRDGSVKVASGDFEVDQREHELAQTIAGICKVAEDLAEMSVTRDELIERCEAKIAQSFIGAASDAVGRLPEDLTGTQADFSEQMRDAFTQVSEPKEKPVLDRSGFIQASRTRELFNQAAEDKFLRGYANTADFRDAFDSAVAAGFGSSRPLLISYMRNYLASDGNIPMDIMVKARDKKSRPEGDAE